LRGSTLLGWTGEGSIADLSNAARGVLKAERRKATLRESGGTVVIDGDRPTETAHMLANLPGVSWVGVGHSSGTLDGAYQELAGLAKTYLRKRGSFWIRPEARGSSPTPGELTGRAVGVVLDAVKGSRVRENAPSTVFTLGWDGRAGTAGVILALGPGGVPTGEATVACLVSGGMHSSVTAWYALLAGLRVELVHARVSDESLREVARLYAELSHRVNPEALKLRVLEGQTIRDAIASWAEAQTGEIFSGVHGWRTGRGVVPRKARAPLLLLPEEGFESALSGLGVRGYSPQPAETSTGHASTRQLTFGGVRTDMNGVLDGLR